MNTNRMTSIFKNKTFIALLFSILGGDLVYSQTPESYFLENEVGISFRGEGKLFYDVGVGSRALLQERFDGEKISGYQHEHLELNLFINYLKKEILVLSLGLRYRFRDLFDDSETDEFRVIEQLLIDPANLPLCHRFRLEQRFRENMIHRFRYDLSYSTPISQNSSFSAGTEALYAVSPQLKPEAEQRFSIGLENSSLRHINLEIGLEYRMENYARNLSHEFFITSGLQVNLQ
ncbi:Protein of unknown function [Salinimicrobium catena]|uniref:DUF2490 domain-containing protein n=1 Tax=Salinimicrobium catena TaxID=390640 RepID=A0A1H5P1C0_9FLAO|nr:DUF2490 domain-containing protein [Salinimicrobium catena]SDL64418.1 Protein of unknown function [Salinimicrobium catena]SEF06778.1 Protein of unknown function [Salinimicrobium catena]